MIPPFSPLIDASRDLSVNVFNSPVNFAYFSDFRVAGGFFLFGDNWPPWG